MACSIVEPGETSTDRRAGRDLHRDRLQRVLAGQAVARRLQRHPDVVVGVAHAHRALALEHPDDLERHRPDQQGPADHRRRVGIEHAGNVGADDGDAAPGGVVRGGEHTAGVDAEGLDAGVVRGCPGDAHVQVAVAGLDLLANRHFRDHCGQARRIPTQQFGIRDLERVLLPRHATHEPHA